jgi:choline dehydrogenase-like flavoprotein
MITDARDLPPGSVIEADVCVVGAGPVGLAVSEALAAGGADVVQLESGGPAHDPAADALGEPGEIEFGTVARLGHTRRIGGNSHAWQVRTGQTWRGVRMMPMGAIDLEGHPSDPGSRWPLGVDELERYHAKAQTWLRLPERDYRAESWAGPLADQVLADAEVASAVFQFADGGALAARAAPDLERAGIRVYHHATAAEVLTDDVAGRATGVRAVSLPGRELTVRAGSVVLAAGGMATTQLLLASDRVRPTGLGNGYDQLGRSFMDHLLLQGGELWPVTPADIRRRTLYDLRMVDGTPVMGHLRLSDDVIRSEDLLGLSLLLYPREAGYLRRRAFSSRQLDGVRGALTVREALLRRQVPPGAAMKEALLGADGAFRKAWAGGLHPESSLGRGGWSTETRRRFVCFEVLHQAEQAPHPDNRVTLSDRRDPLGQRRVAVHWRWHDADADAVVRGQEVFARALRRLGWGELRPDIDDGRPVVRSSSSHHFMGTTRMSSDPRHGVVDSRGAVHGVPNLFVASSSVFPSGGYANVTLTAVALALRVADTVLAARPLEIAPVVSLSGAVGADEAGREPGDDIDDGIDDAADPAAGGASPGRRPALRHAVTAAAVAAHMLTGLPEVPPAEPPEAAREQREQRAEST